MGRPTCSSCCKETVSKEGCRNDDFSVYYKIGGGNWISSSEYAELLLVAYNGAGEQIYKAGFVGMSEIYYRITKKDYGEYQTALNCWNYPAVFLTQDLFDKLKEPDPDNEVPDLINAKFQAGNEDVGLHMPTSWEFQLGDNPESWIWVTRELKGLDTYDEYYAGRDFGFPDQPDAHNFTDGADCGNSSLKVPKPENWLTPDNYLGQIEEMGTCPEGRWPGIDDEEGPCITSVQVKVTSYLVKWCTKIYIKSKTGTDLKIKWVYDEVDSLTWKKEYTLLNQGAPITNINPQEENLLEFDGNKYTVSDDLDIHGQEQNPISRRDVLEPYTDWDHCLTYPFFSFIHYTGIWPPYTHRDIRPLALAVLPPNPNDPDPKGTIEQHATTESGYHADKGFFTSIGVITPRDSVVFNPYTGSLGRGITGDEFSHYDSLFPIQETPIIEGIKELLDPPNPNGLQEDIDARNDENLATIKENLKIQENKNLTTKDPDRVGKVEAPYFEYTDNKIRREKDMAQYIVTEDEPFGDGANENDFNFHIGVPKIVPPPEFPYFIPDDHRRLTNFRDGLDLGLKTMSTFETVMRKDADTDDIGIILVSFRSKRGADKSGMNIEVGMEVYYPIGECQKFTIAGVTNGPAGPVTVTLGGAGVVPISDIELVRDTFRYGINYRAYLLQLLYLKNLPNESSFEEYYNPFKYRVTRIDVVNPSIDLSYTVSLMTNQGLRTVWDEIAYGPAMNMGQVDIKKYQLSEFNATGAGRHSDNPAYIKITKEPAWDGTTGSILFKDDCPDADGNEGIIKLERFEGGEDPENLEDGPVVAGPAVFEFQKEADKVAITSQRFSHINTVHPPEESWVTHFEENEKETIIGIDEGVDFKYKQLPKKSDDLNSPYANGYFFGGWISLKFYLEEVSEWLKELKK